MAWIKVDHNTPQKPELAEIAETLKIHLDEAFGKVTRFWIWADQQTTDGHAPRVTKTRLDLLFGATGFADVMEAVGWLIVDANGIIVPNFSAHIGDTAKKRAQATQRKQISRSKVECHAPRVTQMGQVCDNSATTTRPEKEKEKEEEGGNGAGGTAPGTSTATDPVFMCNHAGLFQAFMFYYSGPSKLYLREEVDSLLSELIRQGIPCEQIMAEIERKERIRSEWPSDFSKRLLAQNKRVHDSEKTSYVSPLDKLKDRLGNRGANMNKEVHKDGN